MKVLREKEERTLTIHFSAFLPSLGMLYITAKEIDTTSYTLKHTQKWTYTLCVICFCGLNAKDNHTVSGSCYEG